jgi:hypothetical protein
MVALCAALALAVCVGAITTAAAANAGQPAVASKKKGKCKRKPVKCAPDVYHLSASGTIEIQGVDPVERWSAEVDLKRQTAQVCHLATQIGACYTQDSGTLTFSASGTVHCGWGPGGTLTVPPFTQNLVPVEDPAFADFVLDFYVDDDTYGFRTGLQYATLQPASGTTYCPPGPNGEPEEHRQIDWIHLGSDSGPPRPGKLGKAHSGSESYVTSDETAHSLQWQLTPKGK